MGHNFCFIVLLWAIISIFSLSWMMKQHGVCLNFIVPSLSFLILHEHGARHVCCCALGFVCERNGGNSSAISSG